MGNSISKEEVRDIIRKTIPEIVKFRRELHRNPEEGLKEINTAKKIRNMTEGSEGHIFPPVLDTDTIIILRGQSPGQNVTLRADIDALKIRETSGKPWTSSTEGMAHSCGHDGHTAILMGTYKILTQLTDKFTGSVRFIFQPAEEGLGGGKRLIEKGILDSPPLPDAVFALHGWPGQPLNSISAEGGPNMAASDRFTIRIDGRGGHGALPHTTIDPILTGAAVVQGIQSIVSRNTDPLSPVVISVCSFHSGDADNAVPDYAELKGTTRYFDPAIGEELPEMLERYIEGISDSMGATYDFEYSYGYIPLVNDYSEVEFVRKTVNHWFGKSAWYEKSSPAMTAEDFAYYLEKAPGAFIRLGMGEDSPGLHNPAYDFNDNALETGITLMTALVLEKLGKS